MSVRKPPEPSRAYLNAYWSNWWKRATHRKPDETLRGKCFGCRKEGVLAVDLIHRGPASPHNLLCDSCFRS